MRQKGEFRAENSFFGFLPHRFCLSLQQIIRDMIAFGRKTGLWMMGSLLLISVAVKAQVVRPNLPAPPIADGSYIWQRLDVVSSSEISDLLKQQYDQSRKTGTFPGYRLQLYFGSGVQARARAEKVRADFNALHPDTRVYLIFKSPDFIVRAGDFRTKSDALKVLKSLTSGFANAFIVSDEVVFPGPVVQGEIK